MTDPTRAPGIEYLQSRTLASAVQQEFVRLMKTGELVMGSRLREIESATRFGVSRAAVREAFRSLEEAGLVRLEKNRGAFVRTFDRREMVELFELRAVYEEAAASRLAAAITDDAQASLEALNRSLETLGARNDIDAYYPLNLDFHDRIVEGAGNSALNRAYQRLADQMHLLRRRGYEHGTGLLHSSREHRAILRALRRRDPPAAAAAARAHVLGGLKRQLAD